MESNPGYNRPKSRRRSYKPHSGPKPSSTPNQASNSPNPERNKDTAQNKNNASVQRLNHSSKNRNRRIPGNKPATPNPMHTPSDNQSARNSPTRSVGVQPNVPKNPPRPEHSPPQRNPGRTEDRTNTSRWIEKRIIIEETYEDICKENERIEKEIWLEIAEIHNLKLD
jgi:hypothetical protein